MSLLIINILILSIFIGVIQAANEIYVSPSGLDTNDGNTISMPVLTITRCVELAGSGGTCFLRGGRYYSFNFIIGLDCIIIILMIVMMTINTSYYMKRYDAFVLFFSFF